MAENGIKVSQIAKDLKVTSKDITERLAGFGITVKGTSVLSEEQLGLVFDIYTNLYDMGDAPIVKPEKKPEPKVEQPKAEEPKEEAKPAKKAEVKEEAKPAKKEAKPEAKKEEPKEKAPEKKIEKKHKEPKKSRNSIS